MPKVKDVEILQDKEAEGQVAENRAAQTVVAETKGADIKLAETKVAEPKVADAKVAETKIAENKEVETKQDENKQPEIPPAAGPALSLAELSATVPTDTESHTSSTDDDSLFADEEAGTIPLPFHSRTTN